MVQHIATDKEDAGPGTLPRTNVGGYRNQNQRLAQTRQLSRARQAALAACAVLAFTTLASAESCRPGAKPMASVELFFGAAGPPAAWRRFLLEVVTPRFPDGLTVLEGHGQWRGPHGLVREATHMVMIFYRPDASSNARIEAIRRIYLRRFSQSSVLRADSSTCVDF